AGTPRPPRRGAFLLRTCGVDGGQCPRTRPPPETRSSSARFSVPCRAPARHNVRSGGCLTADGGFKLRREGSRRAMLKRALLDQYLWSERVLRRERTLRPPRLRLKFHSCEIPNLPMDAIPCPALEPLLGRCPPDLHSERDRHLQLDARSRGRNILQ